MTGAPHRDRWLALACLGAWLLPAHAGSPGATLEQQVKAAYLVNFARFIGFPEVQGDGELAICVHGNSAVREALAPMQGQQVAGRAMVVRDAQPAEGRCRVAFVDHSALQDLRFDAPPGVLTVSDAPRFIERGGMIELVLRDGRLRFRINRDAAQAAGLRVPPQILQLAVE